MTGGHTWGLGDRPLPERPDPTTGLPRPPAAPRWSLAGPLPHGNLHLGSDPTSRPDDDVLPPPPGRGPVLEVHRGTRGDGLLFVGLTAGIMVVAALVDVRVLASWWLWAILAIVAVLGARSVRRTYLAAGADFLQRRRGWVDVYALTEITVGVGQGQHWVTLVDAQDRRTTAGTNDLHANPALWDLVYNGIRHSVARGARVKGTGARNLRPLPPADDSPRELR